MILMGLTRALRISNSARVGTGTVSAFIYLCDLFQDIDAMMHPLPPPAHKSSTCIEWFDPKLMEMEWKWHLFSIYGERSTSNWGQCRGLDCRYNRVVARSKPLIVLRWDDDKSKTIFLQTLGL